MSGWRLWKVFAVLSLTSSLIATASESDNYGQAIATAIVAVAFAVRDV